MTTVHGMAPAVGGGRGDGGGRPSVLLDGTALTVDDVVRVADGEVSVGMSEEGRDRLHRSWLAAREVVTLRPVYGRTTGVGANRYEVVAGSESAGAHGLRLLRSHGSGIGELLPRRQVRAMLAVRANQLLRGGAGLAPVIAETMVAVLNGGGYPAVHEHGAVGTGDLGPLAEAGLAFAGEGAWLGEGAPPPPILIEDGDALALMSSNALTIAQAALAVGAVRGALRATIPVAALTLGAVDGSTEAYAPETHHVPQAGAALVAVEMLRLLGAEPAQGRRLQDPFGLRCLPQVHGPALDALTDVESVLAAELNAANENPLIVPAPGGPAKVRHHGGFHTAQLALALDRLRLALLGTAQLCAARLSMLTDPEMTGLRPFLAAGPPASSGVMLLEYGAGSALAELRAAAFPATLGHIVLSRGIEEHASFASQAARQSLRAATSYRLVLACELVAAVRAHRLRGGGPDSAQPVREAFELADRMLDTDVEDRPLSADVERADALLDPIAATLAR
ncbi:histidine ammonia-lyase [Prauserella marina]|uniref:Histidine ammonia-lyase n=1 Tax=Prauserella marina TaxID=530584 RepID=A0A1G6VHM8_9PSEU|nr:aromatic amino acid ammonia-lyase [Prauserella marina]PWV80371.1 histidine ammonia-lyase [Prauserella marina]SDD52883.1 histidine ammonia-lyase [Prauserella marina]